ncbi:hypothetical protein [Phenylobacterium sp. SCN 70-31]|uniref:hypothetical protein n=1 Tax=Phenylobacterium sp. SCN 70-31 TaxID=1660129 RepID=UPI00086D3646|nr:hypothetical protein [Phenylobacterium sp. SCN 70-31]ODT88036.1 MAG: hypothetical protein ABS78_09035 [Phenylobacterium sp. SCN 70-31]
MDAIESLSIDIVSGPGNGNLLVLAAESGTIEDRRRRKPFFLIEFSEVEVATVWSDTAYSIIGVGAGYGETWLSESDNSDLVSEVRSFRSKTRHFALGGPWNRLEVVASSFAIQQMESEAEVRQAVADAVLA